MSPAPFILNAIAYRIIQTAPILRGDLIEALGYYLEMASDVGVMNTNADPALMSGMTHEEAMLHCARLSAFLAALE